jgi:hypothetical protein
MYCLRAENIKRVQDDSQHFVVYRKVPYVSNTILNYYLLLYDVLSTSPFLSRRW